MNLILRDAVAPEDLGVHLGGDLYAADVDHLVVHEFARKAEDVL